MTKTFCDICEAEIRESVIQNPVAVKSKLRTKGLNNKKIGLTIRAVFLDKDDKILVKYKEPQDGETFLKNLLKGDEPEGDLCINCLFELIDEIDPRTKAKESV